MSNQLSEIIKTRCTKDFKNKVEKYARSQNTTTSNIVLSAVETFVNCNAPNDPDYQYFCSYQCNIIKNKILNLVNLDPNIPAKTKTKIRKELDNYDFSKPFYQ